MKTLKELEAELLGISEELEKLKAEAAQPPGPPKDGTVFSGVTMHLSKYSPMRYENGVLHWQSEEGGWVQMDDGEVVFWYPYTSPEIHTGEPPEEIRQACLDDPKMWIEAQWSRVTDEVETERLRPCGQFRHWQTPGGERVDPEFVVNFRWRIWPPFEVVGE